ncbi:hypothetical protein POVCU1_065480 [Plasmodium ovale curtisi]|uniref:PIR Superfamily Protein n=1 Tax=Plasmodium ovale curtisi TaxID=864141 RepID=A0A1A8X7L3_PLAOA|nr:hypothetical protein POVCU1_065480 [Plasmodium ovale curtisi]
MVQSAMSDKNLEDYIQQTEHYKLCYNSEKIISIINEKLKITFLEIQDTYSNDDALKCCGIVNYYFDLLYSIVISPDILFKDIPNNLIGKIEEKWNEIPKYREINKWKEEIH